MVLMRNKVRSMGLCCCLVLICCHLASSQSDTDYQTFAFRKFEATVLSPYEMIHVNQANAEFVRSHVQNELEERGVTQSSNPSMYADILVNLKLERQNTGGYTGSFDSGGYNKSGFSIYEVGTLVIRLSDAKNNEILWEGSRTVPLWNKKEKKIRRRVDNIVAKIFKSYHIAR